MSKHDPKRAAEVYFDGACPICSREIAFYRKRIQNDVRWTDVALDDAPASDLSRDDALARFHIRQADGALVSGAAAFLALWRNDRRLAPLARLLDRRPFVWVLELGYVGFLRLRRLWR